MVNTTSCRNRPIFRWYNNIKQHPHALHWRAGLYIDGCITSARQKDDPQRVNKEAVIASFAMQNKGGKSVQRASKRRTTDSHTWTLIIKSNTRHPVTTTIADRCEFITQYARRISDMHSCLEGGGGIPRAISATTGSHKQIH